MKLVLENVDRVYTKDGYKTQALSDICVSFQDGDQVMIIENPVRQINTIEHYWPIRQGYTGNYYIDGKSAKEYSHKEQALTGIKYSAIFFRNMHCSNRKVV